MKVGDKVRHAVFGFGIVEDISGMGSTAEITVRFQDVGVKKLMQAWAPLQLVQDQQQKKSPSEIPSQFVGRSRSRGEVPVSHASPRNKKNGSLADQIGALFDLYRTGKLTDAEFSAAKAKILGFEF